MALRAEHHSAQMFEIKNGRLGLYGTEHSKCNRMMTLGFKELYDVLLVLWNSNSEA